MYFFLNLTREEVQKLRVSWTRDWSRNHCKNSKNKPKESSALLITTIIPPPRNFISISQSLSGQKAKLFKPGWSVRIQVLSSDCWSSDEFVHTVTWGMAQMAPPGPKDRASNWDTSSDTDVDLKES